MLLTTLLLLFPFINAQGRSCTTGFNEKGRCVTIFSCKPFVEYLQDSRVQLLSQRFLTYYRKSICDSTQLELAVMHPEDIPRDILVCCAPRHTINVESSINQASTSSRWSSTPIITLHNITNLPLTSTTTSTTKPTMNKPHPLENVQCGVLNTQRISNANSTELNDYPWMALLRYNTTSGLEFECGGTLIAPRYVLTAAHCIQTYNKIVSVRLGEHDLETNEDCEDSSYEDRYCAPPVQDIEVEETIVHRSYNKRGKRNDIALVRLKTEADIEQDNVKLICLPTPEFQRIELKRAIISGWGQTESRNRISNKLLQAELPIESVPVCENYYNVRLTNSHMCAGGENNVDTCYGDSGGPLFAPVQVPSQITPKVFQIGVVSAGADSCGRMNSFTVFTRISSFRNWILDNIKP